MSVATLLLRQVRYENRAFRRNPESAFFTFAFPLIFMVIINLLFTSSFDDGTGTIVRFYTPAIMAFAVINASFTTLAISVAIARDEGLLKRVRGTPMPTPAYLSARVVHSVGVGLLLAAVIALFGAIFYAVEIPLQRIGEFVLVLGLGSACFASLAFAAAALIPTAQAAAAVVNAIVLPLLFISNIFIRIEEGILLTISSLFPVRHFADALQSVYHPDLVGPLDPVNLAWLAGWGVIGLVVAWRTFTWEPRT